MSKHETSNQFKDGLMMDVHPLQTPNTVLTDCLNGTFITYNGNEYVLQNDMGNFKLSKCKLKENYIPVGTASYGDILYIASYNPIDKKFELGSYPSPLQWNSSEENSKRTLYSIIDQAKANVEGDEYNFKYSDLSKNARSVVFSDPKLKLEPGDEYKITTEANSSIEDIIYFIQDENSSEHVITPNLSDDFHPVSWQIPGYFGVKNKILTPYSHKLVLLSAVVKGNTVTYDFQSMFQIMDPSLCENGRFKDFCENLKLNMTYSYKGGDGEDTSETVEFYNSLHSKSSEIETLNEEQKKYFTLYEYKWLSDKKQIVCKYKINISYDKLLVDKKDSGEIITNEVPTTITIMPVYTSSDYSILYDNLQQSTTYIANGANVSSVADNIFYWTCQTDDSENFKCSIHVDFFQANTNDTCEYRYLKFGEIKNANIDFDGSQILNAGTNDLDIIDPKENQLYLMLFKLSTKEKLIGRWFFTDPNPLMTSQGRMDIDCSLNSKLQEFYSNLSDEAELELFDGTWQCKDSEFNNQELSLNDVLVDKQMSDTVFKLEKSANSIKFNDNDLEFLGNTVSVSRKYTLNNNVSTEKGVDFGVLNLKLTWKNNVKLSNLESSNIWIHSDGWICFNEVDKITKQKFIEKDLCWQQNCRSCMDASWTNGFYWDGVGHYSNENNPKDLLNEVVKDKFTKVRFGTRRWAKYGASYHIKKGKNYWMSVWANNKDSVSKTFIACDSSTHGYCFVRFKHLDNVVNNAAIVTFKDSSKKWKRQYLYKLDGNRDYLFNKPSIWYTANITTNDLTLNWMLNGAPKSELGVFNEENVEYDTQSSIEKISDIGTNWKEVLYNEPSIDEDTESLTKKIDDWNEVANNAFGHYQDHSALFYQIEDLLADQPGVKELDSDLLYINYDKWNINRNEYVESSTNSWKRDSKHNFFVKTGDSKLKWDQKTASSFGCDLNFIEAIPTTTGSGDPDTINGHIPCFTYD